MRCPPCFGVHLHLQSDDMQASVNPDMFCMLCLSIVFSQSRCISVLPVKRCKFVP